MSDNQKINCEVHSCLYNGETDCKCKLNNITIKPCTNCHSKTSDESKCGSYVSKN